MSHRHTATAVVLVLAALAVPAGASAATRVVSMGVPGPSQVQAPGPPLDETIPRGAGGGAREAGIRRSRAARLLASFDRLRNNY